MKLQFDSLTPVPEGQASLQRLERRRERRRRQADQRREELLDAAFELYQAAGRHGFNMRDLGLRAGYTAGALYAYFPGKEAILMAMRQRLFDQLSRAVRDARPTRATRNPAPVGAAAREDLFLVRCLAWWRWLTQEPDRIRLLLSMVDPGLPVPAGEAVQEALPVMVQFELATRACREALMAQGMPDEMAAALHQAALVWGVGLLLLQAPRQADASLESRFVQMLQQWRAGQARGEDVGATQGTAAQVDLFGLGTD